MCLWLPEKESSKIPHYAHYMIGAGAIVINDNNQILVVRERYRAVPFWKLPGGYADPGKAHFLCKLYLSLPNKISISFVNMQKSGSVLTKLRY